MKILIVHNSYQQAGGEDRVVDLESMLLESHEGNVVRKHVISNERISGPLEKIFAAISSLFSVKSYFMMKRLIERERPDVVHVHNTFPLLSPSVFYACRSSAVACVATLHNYRLVCPTALLMHDGVVTERSLAHGPWWAVPRRVYRESFFGTFVLSALISLHRRLGTWQRTVDSFIVLSEFSIPRFVQGGLPASKIVVKPNFTSVPKPTDAYRAGLLFVGRISEEKGIDTLLTAVCGLPSGSLRIVGSGPLEGAVKAQPLVEFLGPLNNESVHAEMVRATCLIVPSLWYEGFPMVVVEAFANGLPIIASRIGALGEIIEDGVTGLLFDPGDADALSMKMAWALNNPESMKQMGRAARLRYEEMYTPERNLEILMEIYMSAMEHSVESRQ
ncbi:TPA: glycosyltransferase family 4 protein [Stenotrophomonas maltophilia]